MRKVLGYIIIFLLNIILFSGCSPSRESTSLVDEGEDISSLGTVRSVFSFAQIGKQIAYPSYSGGVYIMDKQGKIVERPFDYEILEITAGEEYFYIYWLSEEKTDEYFERNGYLRIYDTDTQLVKEIILPFTRVSLEDGILYGYYDGTEEFLGWTWTNSNSHIEATTYKEEDKFLDGFPNKIEDWNRIEGGE